MEDRREEPGIFGGLFSSANFDHGYAAIHRLVPQWSDPVTRDECFLGGIRGYAVDVGLAHTVLDARQP